MSTESSSPPLWVIRSEDGTEMRVPNLEKVRTWILTGVVSGQDEIRQGDDESAPWRFVADLPEWADLVGEIDVNNPTTKVADGPVHAIADLVNIDLSAGPPPLPEDGELEDAMAPTHALEIPSEADIEAMLPGNIVYEVPLEPAKDSTVTEMDALDLSDFDDPDPLGPVTRTEPRSWTPDELDGVGDAPTIDVELPKGQGVAKPLSKVTATEDTSPGLLVSVKMQVEAAVAEQQQLDKEPQSPSGPGGTAASEEEDEPEPVDADDLILSSEPDLPVPGRVDLPLSRPVVRKAGALGGGIEALEQAELEEAQLQRSKSVIWVVIGLLAIGGGGGIWWATQSGETDEGTEIASALTKSPETDKQAPDDKAPVPVEAAEAPEP
ncbi:MAG: hypothetical protein VX938_09445, partial [Myxococcota bacterium]|nr:hypothetical protein [Myxococcota bacterium]